jgi:hypothetical protein
MANDDFDIPDILDIPALVAKWPLDGLELPQARQYMPGYERPVPVGPVVRAQGSRAVFEYVKCTKFQICEGELRRILGTGMLVLTGYLRGRPGELVKIPRVLISTVRFHFDQNAFELSDGSIYEGACIYAAARQPKETPLLIEITAPLLTLIRQSEDADKEAEKAEAAKTTAPEFINNKAWLTWAVNEYPPDDWNYGWKTRYKRKLEPLLAEATKQNSRLTASDAATIGSRLDDYDLWPKPPRT